MSDDPKLQLCNGCHRSKIFNADEFKLKTTGELMKMCRKCSDRVSATRRDNRDAEKENGLTESNDALDQDNDTEGLTELTLEVFLDTIASAEKLLSFAALVDISAMPSDGNRASRAKELAKRVWEYNKYRFLYHSEYSKKREPETRFMFHCAQINTRQHQPKKGNSGKQRDKAQMDTFDCHGWLTITIRDDSNIAVVKYNHEEEHIPYCNVEVPEDIQAFIRENTNMTPTQLWDDILTKYPTPSFSRKSIYQIWNNHCSKQWKRDDNEVKSAKKLLQEAASLPETSLYQVVDIPLHEKEGYTALAFSLPPALRQYGGKIRELSLDSAWNTNGSRFEVYALLGELYGSGCPLGYLLIRSPTNGEGGEKENYIRQFLAHIKEAWKVHAIITLTDKDASEINAFREVYPEAKHQLCFWHCLRAIKTRLSILRRHPKHYDVKEAKMEFDWIDQSFVPVAQAENWAPTNQYVAQRTIPNVTLRVNGARQNLAPIPGPAQVSRRLVIRLNNIVQTVVPIPPMRFEDTEQDLFEDSLENEDGNLLEQVKRLNDDRDQDDGPDWMFDAGEVLSNRPEYVFCPAAHRKQLLRKFTIHFCQHPMFPQRKDDGYWSAEQIRRNAVYDMYTFCYQRGLRDVWGYMWASWYCPKMWRLWARSTSPYISRLRTTMNVENHWRQLKHNYLHNCPRPRLDHLVWVLIYKVTPSFMARGNILQDNFHLGRSKQLSTFQTYFKKNWLKHAQKTIESGSKYITNVAEWTCNCGTQIFDSHHLCKHLVQSVPRPPMSFWSEIRRRRVRPLYRHPALMKPGEPEANSNIEGSITDGDDHEILVENVRNILTGGGGWREFGLQGATGKRKREDPDCEPEGNIEPRTSGIKRARSREPSPAVGPSSPEIINLVSSPPSSPGSIEMISREDFEGSKATRVEDSDNDEERENIKELVRKHMDALKKAGEIYENELNNPQTSYKRLLALTRNSFSNGAIHFVADINRHEKTGRKRDTTWGIGKGKVDKRRVRNTMGYVGSTVDTGDNE